MTQCKIQEHRASPSILYTFKNNNKIRLKSSLGGSGIEMVVVWQSLFVVYVVVVIVVVIMVLRDPVNRYHTTRGFNSVAGYLDKVEYIL